MASLERDPSVDFAEPNYLYHAHATIPNDPDFDQLWGLHNPVGDHDIDAPEAWDTRPAARTSSSQCIDSGVAYDHPELERQHLGRTTTRPRATASTTTSTAGSTTRGWDFIQNDNTPLDFNGHGTHVAGTIGAEGNNGADIAGVNWDVSIMPRARRRTPTGASPARRSSTAIKYACANGADIVNGSFGGPGKSTGDRNAIKSHACKNTLFVFAAGNDGASSTRTRTRRTPTRASTGARRPTAVGATNIVCVAATNKNDALAGFSNRGRSAVHLAAPGVDILSSLPQWSTVFSDDLEANFNNWTQGLGRGTPAGEHQALGSARASSRSQGSFSMTDSPGGQLHEQHQNHTIRNNAALEPHRPDRLPRSTTT